MEEGYLAKIIHGDGAKEIKVGEVLLLFVTKVTWLLMYDLSLRVGCFVSHVFIHTYIHINKG